MVLPCRLAHIRSEEISGMVTTSWRLVVFLRGMRKEIWDYTSIEIRCVKNHVLAACDQSWHVLVLRKQLQEVIFSMDWENGKIIICVLPISLGAPKWLPFTRFGREYGRERKRDEDCLRNHCIANSLFMHTLDTK